MDKIENTIRRHHTYLPQFVANPEEETHIPRGIIRPPKIITPWGGPIHAGGGSTVSQLNTAGGTADPNNFFISVLGLPKSACQGIASAYLGRADVEAIYVRNTAGAFSSASNRIGANIVAATDNIRTNCGEGDGNQVAVVFHG